MRLQLACAAVAIVAASVGAAPCRAQGEQSSAPMAQKDEKVFVKLTDSKTELRGRFLRLDAQTFSISVDDKPVDIPIERVARVQAKRRDSLKNGAIIMAIWAGVCTATWCQQGMDEEANLPLDAFLAAGMGALVGAGIDFLIVGRQTVFEPVRTAAASPARLPQPSFAVSFRF